MIRRIAITGPESTGKSQLAAELARYFNTVWVPEYAREYLEIYGSKYSLNDIEDIARGQLKAENVLLKKAREWLFCDTEFIVTKIWAEHAFNECPEWISQQIVSHRYDYYFLCNIDLPWEPDPLREHPDMREYFFDLYRQELSGRDFPFAIISGMGDDRLNCAIKALEQRFSIVLR